MCPFFSRPGEGAHSYLLQEKGAIETPQRTVFTASGLIVDGSTGGNYLTNNSNADKSIAGHVATGKLNAYSFTTHISHTRKLTETSFIWDNSTTDSYMADNFTTDNSIANYFTEYSSTADNLAADNSITNKFTVDSSTPILPSIDTSRPISTFPNLNRQNLEMRFKYEL